MNNSIIKSLKKSELAIDIYDTFKQLYFQYCISDEKLIKKKFKNRLGRDVRLNSPVRYNDKLQWLKLNWYVPIATKCADKFEVREFVTEKIGVEYLNELYGVYESVNDIDLEQLPSSFVLKGTHGSGFNIICKDKSQMDWDKEFKKMRRWFRKNYYWQNREWVYKDIKPRIVSERYIEEKEYGELRDYKIFCFNGEPRIIQVDFDRYHNHKRNFFDLNWNLLDVSIKYPSDKSQKILKPKTLNKMLELSRVLSADFPHVRVDFYNVENNIIFGELTFFHESGMGKFSPEEFEYEMGSWLNLPCEKLEE